MAAEFTAAPEVEAIARDLIGAHHKHLINVPIRYVFRSEAAKSGGKIVWGKARKIGGLQAFLAVKEDDLPVMETEGNEFFVIEIARDIWEDLTDAARAALVDHELMHCETEGDKLVISPHDVEEFSGIIRRHGLWRDDVKIFAQAVKQHELPIFSTSGTASASLN